MTPFRMNVERRGAGKPPMVFVHGLFCRLEDWRYQVEHFEKTNETFALDLRGMGRTPLGDAPLTVETLARDVAEFLEQEDLTRVVLVGHSLGCRIVTEAAVLAADRIGGLVLIEGTRVVGDRETVFASYDEAVATGGYADMMKYRYRTMFFGEPQDWVEEQLTLIDKIDPAAAATLSKSAFDHGTSGRMEEVMREVTAPLLIIQSTILEMGSGPRPIRDGDVPYTQGVAEAAGLTPEVFAHVGPGHFNIIEDPAPVNSRIEQFIAERVTK